MNSNWLSCGGNNQQTTTTTQASDSPATQAKPTFFQQYGSLIFMVLIIVVFIVLMIVPQKRKDKKVKEMLNAIKPGDKVRTIGGVYGTVVSVKDDLVVIESGPNKSQIEFAKGAISTVKSADVEAEDLK